MDVLKKNRFNPAWQSLLRKRRRRRWGRLLVAPLPGILLALLVGMAGWHLSLAPDAATDAAGTVDVELQVERSRAMQRVELALQLHLLLYGELPLQLDELAQRGIIHRSALDKAPWVHPLSYRLTPEGFELEAPRY